MGAAGGGLLGCQGKILSVETSVAPFRRVSGVKIGLGEGMKKIAPEAIVFPLSSPPPPLPLNFPPAFGRKFFGVFFTAVTRRSHYLGEHQSASAG